MRLFFDIRDCMYVEFEDARLLVDVSFLLFVIRKESIANDNTVEQHANREEALTCAYSIPFCVDEADIDVSITSNVHCCCSVAK